MRNQVPFLELKWTYDVLEGEIDEAVSRVLHSGHYLLGRELEAFEAEYADYCGAKHCIGVGNGLDALHLSLRAMGVRAGDEVIVPSNTYIATWLAVSQVGAIPVPVEPDPETCNIDPSRIEAALTARTRAILPVHLYGQPADMGAIGEIAERHHLMVLEDAAQAHGARYKGTRVGAIGDVTAWSFYPTKNLGAFGDSGAVTTDIDVIAERLRLLRNYGAKTKYVNDLKGINSRMEELHAAVLRVKLRHLEDWTRRRTAQAERYIQEFSAIGLRLQSVPEWATPVWHIFTVRTPERDALQSRLAERGVRTLIHYPIPPHLQAAYGEMGRAEGSFPISEEIHKQVLSLPIGPQLGAAQQETVIESVRSAMMEIRSDAQA